MGIQSTIDITREEAIEMIANDRLKKQKKKLLRLYAFELELKTDEELEKELESEYYNYCIMPEAKSRT